MKRERWFGDGLFLETSGTVFYIRQRAYGESERVIVLTQGELDKLVLAGMKMSLMRDIENEKEDNDAER
jgi:hypothetical protein